MIQSEFSKLITDCLHSSEYEYVLPAHTAKHFLWSKLQKLCDFPWHQFTTFYSRWYFVAYVFFFLFSPQFFTSLFENSKATLVLIFISGLKVFSCPQDIYANAYLVCTRLLYFQGPPWHGGTHCLGEFVYGNRGLNDKIAIILWFLATTQECVHLDINETSKDSINDIMSSLNVILYYL